MTRWDAILFVRAAGLALLTLALTWVLTAVTDEGGVSWGERAGRALPLTPVCAALGVWGALAPVRGRGEALALEALGRSQAQIALAAVAGASTVALAASLAIGTISAVGIDGFYPTATRATAWHWRDDGFVDAARGLRMGPDAAPSLVAVTVPQLGRPPAPVHGRAAAALATAATGLAMAMLQGAGLIVWTGAAGRRQHLACVAAVGAAAAATIVLFQVAAARRVPSMVGVLPSFGLLMMALGRYRDATG